MILAGVLARGLVRGERGWRNCGCVFWSWAVGFGIRTRFWSTWGFWRGARRSSLHSATCCDFSLIRGIGEALTGE